MCSTVPVDNITTTALHRLTSSMMETRNSAIMSRLRGYVSENQVNWDNYRLSVTNYCKVQVHWSVNESFFSLEITKISPGPAKVATKCSLLGISGLHHFSIVCRFENKIQCTYLRNGSEENMELARKWHKPHRDPIFWLAFIYMVSIAVCFNRSLLLHSTADPEKRNRIRYYVENNSRIR